MKKINFEEIIKLEEADFIHYLLNKNIDINTINEDGETLSHICCKYGELEKYLVLQYMNANLNLLTIKGQSVLHYCCKYGLNPYLTLEVAKKTKFHLLKDFDGNTPLHLCINKKDIIYFGNWSNINNISLSKLINNNNENVLDINIKNKTGLENIWIDFLEESEYFYKKYNYHLVHDSYINNSHHQVFKNDENQKIIKNIKKTLMIDQNIDQENNK